MIKHLLKYSGVKYLGVKYFGGMLILLLPFAAQADLLERVRLEEVLRTRIEQVVQVNDPKARVLTRVDFKTYTEDLPGTNGLKESYSPSKLESSDIAKIEVVIYSELKELTADTRDAVFKIAPVSKDHVKIEMKHLDAPPAGATPIPHQAVEPKDLSEIAQQSVRSIEQLSKLFLGGFAGLFILAMAVMFVYSSRKIKEFKDQFALLANAISEGGGSRQSPVQAQQQQLSSNTQGAQEALTIPDVALFELFADCYWCEKDGYAHWLWRKMDSEQRSRVLSALPFMNEYSLFFVQTPAQELGYHDHPYYLNPSSCLQLSMDDVNAALAKDLSLWHRLSPLRQARTTISLEQKLKAVQVRPSGSFSWSALKASASRKLKVQATFGDISSQDEEALWKTPTLAPDSMKSNIRSLVWLAQRDEASIKQILGRYDARSLASAWVGAEVVLKKLEAQLPEKKLKLLQMYRDRETPSRSSSVFEALVEEGLRDEAA